MIARLASRLAQLRGDTAGSVVIETAIVAPVLVVLGLGAFDISRMIARQSELQAGSTDVEGIVLAVAGTSTTTNVSTIKSVLMNSLSLSANEVTVVKMYRCNVQNNLETTHGDCGETDVLSTYVQVTLTDSYDPMWTRFGVGSALNYRLVRTVQVS